MGQQLKFSNEEVCKKRFFNMSKAVMGIAAVLALVLVAVPIYVITNNLAATIDERTAATISVDINPGIEIKVNSDNIIVSADSTNADGKNLLAVVSPVDKALGDGFNEIIDKAVEFGYITAEQKHVLVAASVDKDAELADITAYTDSLKSSLAMLEGSESASVLAVYIDDQQLVEDAKKNGLSLGRELLYMFVLPMNSVELSVEDATTLSISEVLSKLNVLNEDGSVKSEFKQTLEGLSILPEETTTTSETTDVTTEANTTADETTVTAEETEATAEETEVPGYAETDKPIITTSNIVTPSDDYELSVSSSGSTLSFSWDSLGKSSVSYNGKKYTGFNYYKVVASATNSSPVYPDDGYLYYCSDNSSSGWSLNLETDDYNRSPELIAGKSYYFSITYVFENGKFSTNTVKIKVPEYEEEETESVEQPQLEVSAGTDSLCFSWTPLNDSSISYNGKNYENFYYYKVVASETNSSPIYPDDGYLYYTSDLNASSWSLRLDGDYNQNPAITAGKTYYFSITYVFENGKFTSNTVKSTFLSAEAQGAVITPEVEVSANGAQIAITWTPLTSTSAQYNGTNYSGFTHYKVMISETNENPAYKGSGSLGLHAAQNYALNSVTVGVGTKGEVTLVSGKTYFVGVSYLFGNGMFTTSGVSFTMP